MWWSHQEQPAAQNDNIKTGDKSFEGAAESRYLGTKLTNQKSVH